MKLITRIMVAVLGAAFLTIAVGRLHAQTNAENVLTISATGSLQNGGAADRVTILPPFKVSIATKQILQFLAEDEHVEQNYALSNFPAGAKLVVLMPSFDINFYLEWMGGTNKEVGAFQVWDKNNNVLVDVSDILSFSYGSNSAFTTNDVYSGRSDHQITGLAFPSWSVEQRATITFDDTGIIGGGGLHFSLTGIETSKFTDTVPKLGTGLYTETQTHKITSGEGSGTFEGRIIFVTGTVSASAKTIHSTSEIGN
jgi:hypothetical protein